jgi:hypothetical protein
MSRPRLTYIPAQSPTTVAVGQSGYLESGQKYHPNPNSKVEDQGLVTKVNPGGWPDPPTGTDILGREIEKSPETTLAEDSSYASMESLVNSLPELPGEQSYVAHESIRGESFSSEVGVIQFDLRGVAVVPHNIARHLYDRNQDKKFFIKYGTLDKSFVEKAKESPQYLKIEEELVSLREKVKTLESLKVNETDAKFLSKIKERPELLGLLNLLLRGKKEMAALFFFLGETILEKKYGLAIATFWKAFEDEFKKCPKSLSKILVDAGIQFEEAETKVKKKKRGRKKKETITSSEM